MLIGPWVVQDGLGIVLVRFFFRLAVWDRFFVPLKPLLARFWCAPGAIFGLLEANFRFLGAVLMSFSGFSGRCSFGTCPLAFGRRSLFYLSMSLVSFPIVVVLLSLFDSSMVLLVPGPCGLRAARLSDNSFLSCSPPNHLK